MGEPKVAEQLKSLLVPVEKLVLDPSNARRHPERNLEAIKASLTKFGQRKPVVVQREGMVVRAGNGLVEAAKALGWDAVAAVVVDENNVDATAYAIADNRTGELSVWDDASLNAQLEALAKEGVTLDDLGWQEGEIERLLGRFDVDGTDAPDVPEGDRSPFQQMTFTLHDDQVETVKAAIDKAKEAGGSESSVNENSNGNALAAICKRFLDG